MKNPEKVNKIQNLDENLYIPDMILKKCIGRPENNVANAKELLDLYQRSKNKLLFTRLFGMLTGVSFSSYLDRCLNELEKESE